MALKNTRIGTDQRFALSLSNAGKKVNMNDVEVLHLCMYSNDQRSNDGSIGYAVNADDATVLDLLWTAKSQSYLGSHSVHGTIRYAGAVASFDIPAVNVVSLTSEADISTDTIVLEAPVGTEDLTATITIQGMGPQGPKGDKMTYEDLSEADKEDIYAGGAEMLKPLLATKANIQHQHTVADITDFPEQYYDATAFFTSGAYPSDKYEELLEAVKAKKTVYATLDEEGNISYVFFTSLANSDASSSRVLLTTIFVDGSYLYLNTFVLRQSGMTRLQENITSKANKATTLAGYGIADAYTKSEVDAALNTKQDTLTAGNGISIEGGVISSTVDSLITPITYAELVALRDSSSLVAGMQYRITDYACTTTQENTQSAGHPFDIIVTADSENTLNEEARAIQHEGDTYFADCDLNAWKIWYCLDNDATRFAWADSANGKGVIYRMIDEWYNDVPYDFKNIQFARDWSVIAPDSGLAGTIYCYTFSVFLDGFSEDAIANDESVKVKVCIESDGSGRLGNNVIRTYQDSVGNYLLNNIIFVTDWSFFSVEHYSNTFGDNCSSNTFGNICFSNIFGGGCSENTFGIGCSENTFGNSCSSNTFGNSCSSNTFGIGCASNTFGNDGSSNTFGIGCSENTFGEGCSENTFGNSCSSNTFGDYCSSNTFGNTCSYIKFATSNSATTKYNFYKQNHFGDGCQFILFKGAGTASDPTRVQNYNFSQGVQGTSSAYLTIDGVRSRAYETKVAKNSSGELKIYCEADLIQ